MNEYDTKMLTRRHVTRDITLAETERGERLCEREDGPECAALPLGRATVTEDALSRGETVSCS